MSPVAQFALLVLINGFVGAMVGVERSVLPLLAEEMTGRAAGTAALSFLVGFGLAKAVANGVAGSLADRWGRRPVLLLGWTLALPVPLLVAAAPTWGWVVAANALLGLSQGLAWSAAVIAKIDLAGPRHRGLAMGLNEAAGYLAVALAAWGAAELSAVYGLRSGPVWLGTGAAIAGAVLSLALVRETVAPRAAAASPLGARDVIARCTWADPHLSAASQAGFANNLNDAVAWGLFPLWFAAAGLSLAEIGALAAIPPAVWGLGQLVTGPLSDRVGRRPLIAGGMWVQAVGLAVVAAGHAAPAFAVGGALLGAGTAMVYPTLLAAVADRAEPAWRGAAVGVYRGWRDLGYAAGALLAGALAGPIGIGGAIAVAAVITAGSGAIAAARIDSRRRIEHPGVGLPVPPGEREVAPVG